MSAARGSFDSVGGFGRVSAFDRIVTRSRFTIRHLAADEIELGPHSHAAYTVATLLSGSLEAVIGGRAVSLVAGESALINVGETHAATARDCELLSVGVRPTVLDELLAEMGWHHPAAHSVFRASIVADPSLSAVSRQIADELGEERPGLEPMLDALVQQLAVYLLRSHLSVRRTANVEYSRVGPIDRRLRRAVELMDAHLDQELSLADLADAVSLSPSHFAHLFRELIGLTPHGYLTNLRLERARGLLVETDLSITEIATRVGFRSPSHFATAFRTVTGASPRAYRMSALDPRNS